MKTKNKIMTFALAGTLSLAMLCGITGCSCAKDKGNANLVNAKDVYAMSAVTSVSYLKNSNTKAVSLTSLNEVTSLDASVLSATTRPENISETNIKELNNCVNMFASMVKQNNGDKNLQTTSKNDSKDELLSTYNFVMTVSLPNLKGANDTYKMYYNELETKTDKEIENEKEEVEVSTKLDGIMVFDDLQYKVVGERNFETEGDESEASIEFTTYFGAEVNANGDYVTVSQSIEKDATTGENEVEYKYKIYKDGKKIQTTSIEVEEENNQKEFEFELKNNDGSTQENKVVYELESIKDKNNEFNIEIKINNTIQKDKIKVTMNEDDSNTYAYDNGYTETLSKNNEIIK